MRLPKLISHDLRDDTLIFRMVGNAIGRVLLKTPITANQLTVFRLLCMIPVYYLFVQAAPKSYLWGGLFFIFLIVLDFTDGYLARAKKSESILGCWLERVFDSLLMRDYSAFGFFIALGIYLRTGNFYVWIILFLNIFAAYANNLLVKVEEEIAGPTPLTSKDKRNSEKSALLNSMIDFVNLFLVWSPLFIAACAMVYGPIASQGIDPVFWSFGLVAAVHQIKWLGRVFFRLNNLYRS